MEIEPMRFGKWLTMVSVALTGALFAAILLVDQGPATAQDNQPIRIVALGDSLTAGYGLATNEAFPVQLQQALTELGIPANVENAGVSGDTTTGGLARLDWSLGAQNPELVIVALGGNDFLRGIPLERTRANMEQLAQSLESRNVPTLIAGMLAPPSMGADYEQGFNAIYPAIAEDTGAYLYPFFLDGVAFERDLNQADGIHPTAEGVAIMVERILPSVVSALIGSGACGTPDSSVCDKAVFDFAS